MAQRLSLSLNFDVKAHYKKIPSNIRFVRFASYPKDIVIEYVIKGLDFYLELDNSFQYDGCETYKFADSDKQNFSFCLTLIRQGGWVKRGAAYVKADE